MQPSIPWSSSVSVFVTERMAIIHSLKCTVPLSFFVSLLSLAVTHCHLLLLTVTRCITRCHLLPLVVIRCYSLSFVVTRCTTRLSFYKWSESSRFWRFHLRQFRTFLISNSYWKKVSLLDEKLNQAFSKAQEAEKIQEQEKPLLQASLRNSMNLP